ncbi:MAG TPA: discoidin domain-containing protein [Anaerolineales bacterium]|nr:discoidin domain-containing protein [Anaerolineales bacterium]
MKPSPSPDYDEQDRKIIGLLNGLRAFESTYYPQELLTARRAAFLAQVEGLKPAELEEESSPADQEIVNLFGNLKSAQAEYPPHLLAARRAAFLQQMGQAAAAPSLWDQLHGSILRIFSYRTAVPSASLPGSLRISLAIASLLLIAFVGSLLLSRMEQASQPAPSQVAGVPTDILPTGISKVALFICQRDNQTPGCPPGGLDPGEDLADPGNGPARPAVSKDARVNSDGAHKPAYVNDGRRGASWVSNSADSWIKIDLGQVRTINTVSLQKGDPGSPSENTPGQFVIAVALSDVYSDGDSSQDYTEYAQVFHSEQAGFSGTVSQAETIRTQFPSVRARYVKITFEQAGAAIEEVGVFLVEPTAPDEQPTITLTAIQANTQLPTDTATATSISTDTPLQSDTAVPTLTRTPPQAASNTSTPLPTASPTLPPADTATPVPTEVLPSDTPIPLPTVVPPTPMPTAIPPVLQPPPAGTDPIIVTGSDQDLTFTCNGNAAEVRGHANTVTLLGSCSSITVAGNGNLVLWQFGSPVITNKGRDNIVRQL